MKDFSYWQEYEGASEGSGRSEKIWLINPDTNQVGLFKLKKDRTTTDHVSECIANDLANLIGIPCAKFELGQYKGSEGSMSYNIVDKGGINLFEGIYFINQVFTNYDAERLMDKDTNQKYSLEMVRKVLESYNVWLDFLYMLIFDYLIGNTDRHQSNWALLLEDGKYTFSPLYDNSSSLCAYVKEENIKAYLGRDLLLWKSLVDTKSKSMLRILCSDVKQPTHLEVLKYIHVNYERKTNNFVRNIIDRMTPEVICDIVGKYEPEFISVEKKKIIIKFLMSKIEMIKMIYFGEEE